MKTLDEIGIANGTDKATQFTRTYAKPHGYLPHMERFFEPLRELPIRLLEIGAAGGESIRTWLEYFPNAEIFGVDIVKDTNPYNTVGTTVDPRYTFAHGDQGLVEFWNQFLHVYATPFDIVVEDGSHYSRDVITTFNCLWPAVASGGFYCIEDLGVAYGGFPFNTPGFQNHMDYVKDMLDAINRQQRDIACLHFSRELAIIQKTAKV